MEQITDINEMHSLLLGTLEFIDKVCKENNIKYSVVGGTAIGAIRHKGFIPWDDDVDIGMLREDYEKFLKIMDSGKYNETKYKCLHYSPLYPNYYYRFAKMVDTTTSLTESNLIKNENMGLYVDIFPFDYANLKTIKTLTNKPQRFSTFLLLASRTKYIWNKKFFKNFVTLPAYIWAKIFGKKYWINKCFNIEKLSNSSPSIFINAFSGCYGLKEVMPKNIYDETISVPFENIKVEIFKNYDTYLFGAYGDYMTPPPPEKRKTHSITVFKK